MEDAFYGVVSWITHDGGLPIMCLVLAALVMLFVTIGRARDRAALAGVRGFALGLGAARIAVLCAVSAAGLLTLAGLCHVACARPKAQHIACLSNVKQIGSGLLMYAQDNDERLPLRAKWSEMPKPYIWNPDIMRCPVVRQGASYGLNAAMAGLSTEAVDRPAMTVLLFEVETADPSFTGGVRDVASTRHTGGSHVGFVDGHAKRVKANGLPGLIWEPQVAEGVGKP